MPQTTERLATVVHMVYDCLDYPRNTVVKDDRTYSVARIMDTAHDYPQKRRRSAAWSRIETSQGNQHESLHDDLPSSKKDARNQTRASTACETCRLKKVKCDEGIPVCAYCKRHGFRCDYHLRSAPSQDQLLSSALDRLVQVEEKLECLLHSSEQDRRREDRNSYESGRVVSNAGLATPSSTITASVYPSVLLPSGHENIDGFQEITSPPESLGTSNYRDDETPHRYHYPTATAEDAVQKVKYSKRTPLSCEESRPPLPDALAHTERTEAAEIILPLKYFFEHTCPLFPIICDHVTNTMAAQVVEKGFQDDVQSCLILLMVALSKAYRNPKSVESGLSDFQRALQILSRLSVQFTLEYAQAQALAALFLFKKGRLLSFWSYLHASCSTLYTMIRQDHNLGYERSIVETMTILRLYWISYNLERDLLNESDSFPRSLLFHLEDRLPLPLGCDESNTVQLESSTRTTYTFFLAEMSLKAIIARILATPDLEYSAEKPSHCKVEISPLTQELKTQIHGWEASLPTFLEWSPEPRKGVILPVGVRLKLLYWYARFSLFRPLIVHFLHDLNNQLPFLGWTFFQDGLLAGLNMVKVSILEEPDIDVIMGNRLVSTITVLRDAAAKGCFTVLSHENVNNVLQDSISMLWRRLGCKSEWITCRLHSL